MKVNETELTARPAVFSTLQILSDTTYTSPEDEKNNNKNRMFMGMIKLENDMIIAIERSGGALYEVKDDYYSRIEYTGTESSATWIESGKYSTGALALWEENVTPPPGKKMLIAGVQGSLYNTTTSSYSHGYVEFELDEFGSLKTDVVRSDPPVITVDNYTDRYTATIGKHPINHLFQAPNTIDANMTFFASTQTAGLWSYRNRVDSGGPQWNAEN